MALVLVVSLIVFSTSLPAYEDTTVTEANLGSLVTDTTAMQKIDKLAYSSSNEAMVLNVSPQRLGAYSFFVPIYDYDTLRVNVTLGMTSGATNVTFNVRVRNSANSSRVEAVAGEFSTYSLMAPLDLVRSQTTGWLQVGTITLSTNVDAVSVIVERIVVYATSQQPLCPVTIDIQSSDGDSLYENEYMNDLRVQPLMHLGKTGSNHSAPVLTPIRSMDTIYVNPGQYNGTVYWGPHLGLSEIRLTANLTLNVNEAVIWQFRLPVIEISFTCDPVMPIYSIDIGNLSDLYSLDVVLGGVPEILYLPPINTTIYIEAGVPDIWRGSRRIDGTIPNTAAMIVIDGNHNIEVSVTTTYMVILGTGFTASELVIIGIGAVLLIIVMTRLILLFIPEYMTRNIKDLRIFAVIVFGITGFLPWFVTNIPLTGAPQNNPILTYTFWSALSMTGVSAGESIVLPVVQDFYFYVGLSAFAFYWMPLAFLITHSGTPRSWAEDGMFNIVMLPQAFLAGFSFWYTEFNIHYTTPLLGTYLAIGTPIAWFVMRQVWKLIRGAVPSNHDTIKSIEHAREFVPNIVAELGNPTNVETRAMEILEEIKTDTVKHDSYDPVGFAAGAVFMACLEYECEGMDETKLVLAAGVDSMRLRPIFRVIGDQLTKEDSEVAE